MILEEIKLEIERASVDYTKANDQIMFREGANLLLPILEKLVAQRDEEIKAYDYLFKKIDSPTKISRRWVEFNINEMNAELINLLKSSK